MGRYVWPENARETALPSHTRAYASYDDLHEHSMLDALISKGQRCVPYIAKARCGILSRPIKSCHISQDPVSAVYVPKVKS